MSLLPATDKPGAITASLMTGQPTAQPASFGTTTAVLELFTSQGCSSCPSADALLAELYEEYDDLITLSFHVDYWNYLGWADPFSSPYFSARQTDYSGALKARTYTPQLVVNGRREMIGSRKAEVRQATRQALKSGLSLTPSFTRTIVGKEVMIDYTLPDISLGCRVTALLVQPEATSAIKRGENRGRDLHHVNVVRAMVHGPATAKGTLNLAAPEGYDPATGKVVVLVQHEATLEIVGAVKQ